MPAVIHNGITMPSKKIQSKADVPPPTTIRIPSEMLERIDVLAEATTRSRSHMIIELLKHALDTYKASQQLTSRK